MTISQAARNRSIVGVMLALPIAALIAGIFACLPVPLGDPEKSKIDHKLTGGWLLADDGGKSTVYLVEAFDARAYMVTSLDYSRQADKSIKTGKMGHMKAWLTPIGDKAFICVQPLNPAAVLGVEKDDKQLYFCAQVAHKGDTLELTPTKAESDLIKDIKTPAEAEKVIKEHLNNPAIYDKPIVLKRMGKDQAEDSRAILTAFGLD